ncbi:MAG TPA: indole-3-glycerol phosphate synthase TrpC [Kofleriaceae bacterium]|nr:indole-3-glycerol phosphate synthase TrpC [Kofleriaceae bacterium]
MRVVPKNILAEILEAKRAEIDRARAEHPLSELEARARAAPRPRGMTDALRRGDGQPVRFIAEIKRASPSAGPIRPGADPAEIAREYAAAGAAAISILTDARFFDGRLEFVPAVAAAVSVPLLRKDFLLDPHQVVESRAHAADAVLLIAAALGPAQLGELLDETRRWGMDALVEVHDEAEAERAAAAGADLIGVNHRDLGTFAIDMELTARIAPLLPAGAVVVAESGIQTAEDVVRLGQAGAHAVLVGERLMRAPSPGAALIELAGRPGQGTA